MVADLGVADRIGDSPVPVTDLADSCAVEADALDRVLRLLATHGVFQKHDGGYGHTVSSRLLRADHPMSMRAFSQMMGLPLIWSSLTELAHAVRNGSPGLEILEPEGPWAYLRAHPGEAEIFGRAMTAKAGAEIAAVLDVYDFGELRTIADIGGGRGHLLCAVLGATPESHGILFDLPEVIDSLDLGHERMTATAGDFFVDPLPVADAYVLMEVLHDWADEECVAILRAIRRAAPAGSRLLIIEGVIPEEQPDPRASVLDIVMLTVTGGRERTTNEFSALFERAGFCLDKVVGTASPIRIVEARPV
ncbi:MAG TPA: methyltransferase [Pseudonocardiaceae bacterium]|nr:methyltransferase [Pseudonocardiaceae bacterium]